MAMAKVGKCRLEVSSWMTEHILLKECADMAEAKVRMCTLEVSSWMTEHMLMCNEEKTERALFETQ